MSRHNHNWDGQEVSLIAQAYRLIGIDVQVVKEFDPGFDKKRVLLYWYEKMRATCFMVKPDFDLKKKFECWGKKDSIWQLSQNIAHDFECGCDSCVNNIISYVKDNNPDESTDAQKQEMLKRFYDRMRGIYRY